MKYDTEMIKKIKLFEDVTGAKVKDAFYYRDRLTFLVQPGEMGKALGRNKKNIKKVQGMMNDKVKVVEFDSEEVKFIQNFLNPLEVQNISEEDGVVTIKGGDKKTNGLIIGRNGRNLDKLEEVAQNYFELDEIKVE